VKIIVELKPKRILYGYPQFRHHFHLISTVALLLSSFKHNIRIDSIVFFVKTTLTIFFVIVPRTYFPFTKNRPTGIKRFGIPLEGVPD
jgi:hypothetical protein